MVCNEKKITISEGDRPWGTNPQPRDSIDKLDTNRAEATTLWNGIIDSKHPNSTGNLITEKKMSLLGLVLGLEEGNVNNSDVGVVSPGSARKAWRRERKRRERGFGELVMVMSNNTL